jgi:hypothetical protein
MSGALGDISRPWRRRIDALIEAAKTAWYVFLRTTRLVAPIFADRGPGATGSRRHPAEYPIAESGDPILRTLRQRTVVELLEWLDLEQIPRGYWTLLERMGNPSRALITFMANSGFDPMLVRKRDATELAAFQSFVRFVCQIEESADLVSNRQRALLDRHMYYGEHAQVRSLLELFVTLNQAVTLFERSPEAYRPAAFRRHASRVAALRASAGLADLPEAKMLLEISARQARLTRRFRNAAERKERVEAAAEQGVTLSQHDQGAWASLLSELAQAQSALMGDDETDAEAMVEDFERSVGRLAALLDGAAKPTRDEADARHAAEERKRREQQARRASHGPSEDELLAMFGFPPGTLPDLSSLRRAFIREASKFHPVSGQPDYHERNERYRILKDAYERLKIAFD